MEGELFKALYQLVRREAALRKRRARVRYSDALILLVYFWSVLHDRPRVWACRWENWPVQARDWFDALPSESTICRRMRSLSVMLLFTSLYQHLATLGPATLVRKIDSKPLAVSSFSKDRDARRGYGAGQMLRGYKLFCVWGGGIVPDALLVGPMNRSDPAAAAWMIQHLPGSGYLLADVSHDSNPLHAISARHGFQLVAPRKCPGTGLGHKSHEPSRLRSIELLESDALFGPGLYAQRTEIEREFAHAGNFGGGLQPLPNWVRRPRRVTLWIVAKLILNGLRLRNQRLAA